MDTMRSEGGLIRCFRTAKLLRYADIYVYNTQHLVMVSAGERRLCMSDALLEIVQLSLSSTPENMLRAALDTCIRMTGASGGSLLGEEGPHLKFLFSNVEELIGRTVPFESLAGHCVRNNLVIYTYAPADQRHYNAIDSETKHATRYLLSLPVPSIHQRTSDKPAGAGAVLQLLFDEEVCPAVNVTDGACEFEVEHFRDSEIGGDKLQDLFMVLPLIALGIEVMTLRQTSYQAIHELKNKMIAAQSWLDYLRDDIKAQSAEIMENSAVLEDFELAETSVKQGATLAKTWLQFTKMYQPDFSDEELLPVLKRVAASIRVLGKELGRDDLEVQLDAPENLPLRQLDTEKLEMAFYNLCKNAVEVLVEHQVEKPLINIVCREANQMFEIEIADNGPGMPEEIAENLFVAFKTKKEGGTGLGLTITKKIIELHSGTIECRTGKDGTRFLISI